MNDTLPQEIQDLHAYADGQLTPESRRRVESRLANDPEARRQVEEYEAIRQGLKALYDPVLAEPIPQRFHRQRPQLWPRRLGAFAAGVLLLLSGIWIGLHLQTRALVPLAGTPQLVREAAMAYAVYTPEVRHPVEVPGDQEQHLVTWLTKRIGAPIQAPRLDGLGFRLVGGRLLSSDDGPGALLMYENTGGQRVILYMCHNQNEGRDTAFRIASHEQISVFYWFDGPLSYALAGEIDRNSLLGLAQIVYRETAI